jgi:hypothetical protein
MDGTIILQWILKKWDGGHGLISLAQDRDRWQALVKTVMNLQVPQNARIFSVTTDLLASQESLCSMELELLDVMERPLSGGKQGLRYYLNHWTPQLTIF